MKKAKILSRAGEKRELDFGSFDCIFMLGTAMMTWKKIGQAEHHILVLRGINCKSLTQHVRRLLTIGSNCQVLNALQKEKIHQVQP